MTRSEIDKWIDEHIAMKATKNACYGDGYLNSVKYENGETYSCYINSDNMRKIIVIKINDKIENISLYHSIGCGNYKLVSETTF